MHSIDSHSRNIKQEILVTMKKQLLAEKENYIESQTVKNPYKSKDKLLFENNSKNFYEEKIKALEEKIRKCEIEKAELDLKLSQYERKVKKDLDKSTGSITKLLYIENRELKRRVKELGKEVEDSEKEKVKIQSEIISDERYLEIKPQNAKLNKKMQNTINNTFSEHHPEKRNVTTSINHKEISEDYKLEEQNAQLKRVLKRQKLKYIKSINTIKLVNCIKAQLIKVFRTLSMPMVQNYEANSDIISKPEISINAIRCLIKLSGIKNRLSEKVSRENMYFSRWRCRSNASKNIVMIIAKNIKNNLRMSIHKWKISTHKDIIDKFKLKSAVAMNSVYVKLSKIRIFFAFKNQIIKERRIDTMSKMIEIENEISLAKEQINQMNLMLNKKNSLYFLSIIAKIMLIRYSEIIRKILLYKKYKESCIASIKRSCWKKIENLRITSFNVWKHEVSEMNINDLCILHEEQKIEKDTLIQHFNSFNHDESFESKTTQQVTYFLKIIKSTIRKYTLSSQLRALKKWKNLINESNNITSTLNLIGKRFELTEKRIKSNALYQLIHYYRQVLVRDKIKVSALRNFMISKSKKYMFLFMKKWIYTTQKCNLETQRFNSILKQKYLSTINLYFRKLQKAFFYSRSCEKDIKIRELNQVKDNLEKKINQAFGIMQDSNQLLGNLEKKLAKMKIQSVGNFLHKKINSEMQRSLRTWRENKDRILAQMKQIHRVSGFYPRYLLRSAFNLWSNCNYQSTLLEILNQERVDSFMCKVIRILNLFKKVKLSYSTDIWKYHVKRSKVVSHIYQKLSKSLNSKLLFNKVMVFQKIVSYNAYQAPTKKNPQLQLVVTKGESRMKLMKMKSFHCLRYNVYKVDLTTAKFDCSELVTLANYSEDLIKEKDESMVHILKLASRKIKKSVMIIDKVKKSKLLSRIFTSWGKHYKSRKNHIGKVFSILNYNIKKTSFQYIEKHSKKLLKSSNKPQSLDFLNSLNSYTIYTSQSSTSEKILSWIRILYNIYYRPVLMLNFSKWRKTAKINPRFLVQENFGLSIINKIAPPRSSENSLRLLYVLKSYEKSLPRINHSFSIWKSDVRLSKERSKHQEFTNLLSDLSSERSKVAEREEMIKKLLQENMNLAYKISNVKVQTKDFLNQADKVYSKSNKENLLPSKIPSKYSSHP